MKDKKNHKRASTFCVFFFLNCELYNGKILLYINKQLFVIFNLTRASYNLLE